MELNFIEPPSIGEILRLNRPTAFIYLAVERFSSTRFVL